MDKAKDDLIQVEELDNIELDYVAKEECPPGTMLEIEENDGSITKHKVYCFFICDVYTRLKDGTRVKQDLIIAPIILSYKNTYLSPCLYGKICLPELN